MLRVAMADSRLPTLTGAQLSALHQALLKAFPNVDALREMTAFQLDERLDELVSTASLRTAAFELVVWARARGRLDALLTGALAHNPGSPELRADREARGAVLGRGQHALLCGQHHQARLTPHHALPAQTIGRTPDAIAVAQQPAVGPGHQRVDLLRRARHRGKAVAAIGRAPQPGVLRPRQHHAAAVKVGRDGDAQHHAVGAFAAFPCPAAVGRAVEPVFRPRKDDLPCRPGPLGRRRRPGQRQHLVVVQPIVGGPPRAPAVERTQHPAAFAAGQQYAGLLHARVRRQCHDAAVDIIHPARLPVGAAVQRKRHTQRGAAYQQPALGRQAARRILVRLRHRLQRVSLDGEQPLRPRTPNTSRISGQRKQYRHAKILFNSRTDRQGRGLPGGMQARTPALRMLPDLVP